MASSTTIPFMIGGATVNEGSTLARFSLLAPEIRTGKLINCVGLRNETAARWKKTAGLMGGRWRGMRKIGGGSWSALCSKSGNKDSSADGGEKVDIDALTETLEKKSQKIMELHSGILKKLEERRNLIAEFKLIINTPVDEDTPADEDTSAQDSGSPPLHDLKSSDKKDLNNERDWASLSSSSSDQSPSGKAVEKSTTVSKAKMDVGSNNMEIVNKKDAIGSISSRNINSVPRFPEKSTTRSASTSKESGKKPKRSSSPQVFSKKFEDRPDVSKRLPNGVNERTDSLRPHLTKSSPDVNDSLEGIPELIAEEIRKSISAAAVSSPQEEKSIEPLFNEVISETNNVSHEDVKLPPLAGENAMNVILVAAECSPWKKTGGLGDVAGALPKALARRGHRVMVVVPRYGNYADSQDLGVRKRYKVAGQDMEVNYFHAFIDGVDFVFIESPILRHIEDNIYGGNWMDLLRRMTLFCKAAVEVPWHVPCGGICYGDGNLVFIANDWHTALLPVYLKAYYRDNGLMTYTRSILVIHNIAHQGRGPLESSFSSLDLPGHYIDYFKLYDPVGGEHCNIFAAGIKTADRVVAVSHGYAWELKTNEGGWGLHNIINENDWKLQGIVNGIDYNEWNPQVDEHLKSDGYTNYSLSTLPTGKAQCKAALQAEMGLPVRPDVPLIGFIGRLDGQKGVDIIGEAIPWMMDQDVQLVMLGTGRPDLEDMLKWFENQYKDKIRGWVGFSVSTAHRITAGVDILLMPSRFEPCGLNQLYAMCYGTIPVVHSVGGLRDTVHPYDPFSDTGYGWTFDRAECGKLIEALGYCLMTFRDYKKSWEGLQRRGMTQDLSWDHAAQIYEEVLVAAKYQW